MQPYPARRPHFPSPIAPPWPAFPSKRLTLPSERDQVFWQDLGTAGISLAQYEVTGENGKRVSSNSVLDGCCLGLRLVLNQEKSKSLAGFMASGRWVITGTTDILSVARCHRRTRCPSYCTSLVNSCLPLSYAHVPCGEFCLPE